LLCIAIQYIKLLGTSEKNSYSGYFAAKRQKTKHLQTAQADTKPKFAKELFSCQRTSG
jgi:hypothetical protein